MPDHLFFQEKVFGRGTEVTALLSGTVRQADEGEMR